MAAAVCAKCGGTGWVLIEREGISGAARCDCLDQERAQRLETQASIPPLYRHAHFENFSTSASDPNDQQRLRSIMGSVRTYTREYPAIKAPGLLFIGDPGSGKTHLAVAALRALVARGFEGVFFDYQNLLDRIRAGYDATSGSSDKEAYRFALDTEVLMLDDLGAHRVTDWVEDTITSIITHRCNHRKALIATTNLPDPDAGDKLASAGRYKISLAERIGMRARSRLFEMCTVIHMPMVEDYRIRKVHAR